MEYKYSFYNIINNYCIIFFVYSLQSNYKAGALNYCPDNATVTSETKYFSVPCGEWIDMHPFNRQDDSQLFLSAIYTKDLFYLYANMNITWTTHKPVKNLHGFLIKLTDVNKNTLGEEECIWYNLTTKSTRSSVDPPADDATGEDQKTFSISCFGERYGHVYYVQLFSFVTQHQYGSIYADAYIKMPPDHQKLNIPKDWATYVYTKNNSFLKTIDVRFGYAPESFRMDSYAVSLVRVDDFGSSQQEIEVKRQNGEFEGEVVFRNVCTSSQPYIIYVEPINTNYWNDCNCRCKHDIARCGCDRFCLNTVSSTVMITGTPGTCTPETETTTHSVGNPVTHPNIGVLHIIILSCSASLIGLVFVIVLFLRAKRQKENAQQRIPDDASSLFMEENSVSDSGYTSFQKDRIFQWVSQTVTNSQETQSVQTPSSQTVNNIESEHNFIPPPSLSEVGSNLSELINYDSCMTSDCHVSIIKHCNI